MFTGHVNPISLETSGIIFILPAQTHFPCLRAYPHPSSPTFVPMPVKRKMSEEPKEHKKSEPEEPQPKTEPEEPKQPQPSNGSDDESLMPEGGGPGIFPTKKELAETKRKQQRLRRQTQIPLVRPKQRWLGRQT